MDPQNNILFHGVSNEDCARMLTCFHAKAAQFHAGDTVCNYENTNGRLGLVQAGDISLIRVDENGARTILETMKAGGVFGECLAFSGHRDAIAVIADTDCTVLFIAYDEISKRCSNACTCHTQITENLFRLISEKALRLSERVEVLSRRSIRERLLCYFNLCAGHAASRQFALPFSGTALADYLCVDRSAMLRELKKMKDEGLVDINRRAVNAHFLQQI